MASISDYVLLETTFTVLQFLIIDPSSRWPIETDAEG